MSKKEYSNSTNEVMENKNVNDLKVDISNNNNYDIVANMHPDDVKDKVFVAIIKALVKNGNVPSTPKELSQYILKYKLTNLG